MSAHKGRCFRSLRRCKRRKERQAAAVAELRRRQPQAPMFAQRGFQLTEDSRFSLMRGFNQLGLMRTLRRGGRRGS